MTSHAMIRRATPADINAMARIRAEGGWEGGAPAPRMAAYLAGEHHPQHALLPRVIFVAEDAGSMVGFIAGHLTRRYECDGELEWIFVLPAERGGDVASQLLHQLANWFLEQGARRICVDVDPANDRARRFYRRHGAEDLNKHWLVWPDIAGLKGPRYT